MPKAIDAEFELTAARAMLAELEAYLRSEVVFWQTAPNALGDRMPKLTIGGLLEALARAEAAGAPGVQSMRAELEEIKAQHFQRYLARTEQEAGSRLDAWSWYLDDYARKPAEVADYYAHEVRARLKAELLLAELEPPRGQTERARAAVLDERVRAAFAPGAFVWDERLRKFFTPEKFWWLYGRLRAPEED